MRVLHFPLFCGKRAFPHYRYHNLLLSYFNLFILNHFCEVYDCSNYANILVTSGLLTQIKCQGQEEACMRLRIQHHTSGMLMGFCVTERTNANPNKITTFL